MAEPAPARTIRLVRSPETDGIGVFCITIAGRAQFYALCELPCEIGGRGFAVHRLGMGTVYHVRINTPQDSSCECLGFLRWGRCKHVLGLRALINQGLL
ncbi:MAG: hypothetical protein JWO38_8086 [Gemmataceae bacterium]|nr:hypothetical protein [Gemmataceae bacterium]